MKIGVVSDTHGCVETWRHVYQNYLYDADLIIHAGDVLYHGPRNAIPGEYNPKELAAELNSCPVPIVIVQGNCDAEVDGMVLDIPITKNSLVYQDGLRIYTQHGHDLDQSTMVALAERYKLDIIITGHTHIPELRASGGCVFLNPGSPVQVMSKREDRQGTLAIITDNEVAIFEVDSGNCILELEIVRKTNGMEGQLCPIN
jgi:hypothetical protein